MSDLVGIPVIFMRGGTSRGPFFKATDLPQDVSARDRVLLAAMGSPDPRQIDGLGGADTLTSKVAIVSKSTRPGVDVDYLFAQVDIGKPLVDTNPSCGNRSEEHTSELQFTWPYLVCRLLLEKKTTHT